MKKPPKKLRTVADLAPDPHNANKHTERGLGMLDKSLERYGAGRSILVDRRGVVIAGNATLERAAEKGFPVKVVESDGRALVVVQRTDLDIRDKAARELAIADNRVAQVGLDWDAEQLRALLADGVDVSEFFRDGELEDLLKQFEIEGGDAPGLKDGDRTPFQQVTFTLHDSQATSLQEALAKAKASGGAKSDVNENSNGNALAYICARFLCG